MYSPLRHVTTSVIAPQKASKKRQRAQQSAYRYRAGESTRIHFFTENLLSLSLSLKVLEY